MRIIKTVVIVMGVVIIVGTGVLFWQLYNLSSKPAAAPRTSPTAATTAPSPSAAAPASPSGAASGVTPATGFGAVSLGLPAGCEIAGADAADGRLIVRTNCGAVHVLDLATGAPLGTVTR